MNQTVWDVRIEPMSKPKAAGTERREYLSRARKRRRTHGRTSGNEIKASAKYRKASVLFHGDGYARLPQEAIDWLLRPRRLSRVVHLNGEPESEPIFVSTKARHAEVRRTIRKRSIGGLDIVKGIVVRPSTDVPWRAPVYVQAPPRDLPAHKLAEIVEAGQRMADVSPGRDSQ